MQFDGGFAQALARRASDPEKLLARPQNPLVPDDRTGLLSSPDYGKNLHYPCKRNKH